MARLVHLGQACGSTRRGASRSRSRSSRGSSGRAQAEEDAQKVRELLRDRIQDGWITLDRLVIEGHQVVAIIVDNDTRLVVQGLTGREGSFHGVRNRDYGTDVVGGRRGRARPTSGSIPVFSTPWPRR